MLSLDRVGADSLAAWKSDVDLGDLVFVHGEVIASRRGELFVLADSGRSLAKALRPLPVAHRPLSEESQVRLRYVDLIVRPEARRMVELRATVLRSPRSALDSRGYLEVETPVLQVVHGGAAAAPFPDPSEHLRPGHVAAHRHRAVPQAGSRRRHRARSMNSADRFATKASTRPIPRNTRI